MENQSNIQQTSQNLEGNSSSITQTNLSTPMERTKLCTMFRRGTCPNLPSECKFAHGAKYLVYVKEDLSKIPKSEPKPIVPKDSKKSKKTKTDTETKEESENKSPNEEEEEDEILFEKVLDFENHHLIFKFQEECFAKGLVKEFYTLEQLNTDINCLREIRKLYRATIAQEFFTLLCETYQTTYLPRHVVAHCFKKIGWEPRWVYLTRNYYATERKVKNEEYIIKLPMGRDFENFIKSAIIKIVKDYKLLSSLPINPATIRISFFKDIMSKDAFSPEITFFLKINNYAKLDDYLKVLEKDEEFMRQMCQECGYDYEVIKSQTVFDEESPAFLKFKKELEELLLELIKKSSFGFVLYSEYKTKVFQTFHKQIHEFSKSDTQVERLMQEYAFKNKVLILNLLSDTYLFSVKKIQDTKLVNLRKEVPKALHQSCFESHEPINSGHTHFNFHHEINPNTEHVYDKIDEEILKKELNLSKVVLVDSIESLNIAKDIFKTVNEVAIDLEGSLSKGGTIELLQCGCDKKIVIFDLYDINSKAAKATKAGKTESPEILLSVEVNGFIKSFMEDTKICKVFHDCRRDTLALHLFTNSCPNNIIDVSALYMLIEQLKKYQQFAGVVGLAKPKLNEEEQKNENNETHTVLNDKSIFAIMEEISKYWPPGLNDVLNKYEASHGANGLKLIFKERFDKMSKEYFLKRPIDKEFLIYSARDVEDLVEVKNKMVKMIFELMVSLGINIDEEKANYVSLAASKTYSIFGCDHRKD